MLEKKELGYMALLRNLRNVSEIGDERAIDMACEQLVDVEAVKNSKQLPFRFYEAYKNVENSKMLSAINKALEISLSNVPKYEGKTLIAVDVSGSMMGRPIEIASLFAGALFKANDSDVITYDTEIKIPKLMKEDSLVTTAEKLLRAQGGGTNTSLVFQWAEGKEKYDRIIILSDNESWQDGTNWLGSISGRGTQSAYNKYRQFNDCFVYLVDIAGYGTKDIGSEKVFYTAGWSEKIFDFINIFENKGNIVDEINKIKL
jgi:hypothetical protein